MDRRRQFMRSGASVRLGHDDDDEEEELSPDEAARRHATNVIRTLFGSADQLARVTHYRREYGVKYEEAANELSSAVAQQLDETRRGTQLLVESQHNIKQMHTNFVAIDDYCRQCQSLLREWEDIKLINTTKINVDATVGLLNSFRSIPVLSNAMLDLLDEDDRNIKQVYLDLRRLVRLRDTASSDSFSFSQNFRSRIGDSFEKLDDCARVVEARIWENLSFALVLCRDDPAVLVRTLEVVMIEDKANNKVFGSKKGGNHTRYMVNKMRDELRKTVVEQFLDLYLSFQEYEMERERSETEEDKPGNSKEEEKKEVGGKLDGNRYLCGIFESLKDLMLDLDEIKDLLGPIFPPKLNIPQFVEDEYCKQFTAIVERHLSDPLSLVPKQLLNSVKFLQWCVDQLASLDHQLRTTYDGLVTDLMMRFIDSSKGNLQKLLQNSIILDQKTEAKIASDGLSVTTFPAEFFSVVYAELDLVFDQAGLRGRAVWPVIHSLLSFISDTQKAQTTFFTQVVVKEDKLQFGPAMMVKEDSYVAATINNATQCEDLLNDVRDRCLQALAEGESVQHTNDLAPIIEDAFEECALGYVTLATTCVNLLVKKMITELEPNYREMFGQKWLSGDASNEFIENVIDMLAKYHKWIRDAAYFRMVLKKTVSTIVVEYFTQFMQRKPKVGSNDYSRILADEELFFDSFTQVVDDKPTLTVVEDNLRTLNMLEALLLADKDFMSLHFDGVMAAFGRDALDILMGVLGRRADLSKQDRRQIMMDFEAKYTDGQAGQMINPKLMRVTSLRPKEMNSDERKAGLGESLSSKGKMSNLSNNFFSKFKSIRSWNT